MNIKLIGKPAIAMDNRNGIHNYFGWPSIARLQDGRLAVVSSGFRIEHVCPFGKACISYSDDDGETWTRPAPVIDTPLDDRDAGIVPFGEKGVILTSFNNTVDFQRQSNPDNRYIGAYLDLVDDETCAKYVGAEFCISNDCGKTFGEIYKSPVTSPHGPCVLRDGTILWVGRTFNDHDSFTDGEQGIRCFEMHTDGSMDYVGEIPDIEGLNSSEPHVAELPDGTLICHIRTEENFSVFQSESHDRGKTWTAPRRILPDFGGSPSHLLLHSSGVLIAAYGVREYPYGIDIMFSEDGGKTWETGHRIYENRITDDIGYPSTSELPDGSLITVFYAHPEENSPAVIMQQKWSFGK